MAKSWLAAVAAAAFLSIGGLGVSEATAGGGSLKDGYRSPAFSWTGFYIGGHAGLATGQTAGEVDLGGLLTINTDYDMSGGLWGGHIGYNHQAGHTVLGIEGTWSALDLNGSTTCVVVFNCTRSTNWLATLVGRIGIAMDRAMVYGLAGVAWGDVETSVRDNIVGIIRLDGGATHVGWVAGLGFEYAITPNILARIEYNHVDLGSKTHDLDLSLAGVPIGLTLPSKVDLTVDTIKVGVSWKFH
jgi:outer membrane immunogenic protein